MARINIGYRNSKRAVNRVKQAWKEAATGAMPIVFAAWLSIAAYRLVERMSTIFHTKPNAYVMIHIDLIDIFD